MQSLPKISDFTFCLVTLKDKDLIKEWWRKPHVVKFWDNSPEMWQNAENYLLGQKDFFDYWLGFLKAIPFSLILTSEIKKDISPTDLYYPYLDKGGLTMSLDFMIGEEAFLGKGLAPLTLKAFMNFLRENKGATNFIIDPAISNQRAVNAYQNAGFKIVHTFIREKGYFKDIEHYLMRMMVRDENISSQK